MLPHLARLSEADEEADPVGVVEQEVAREQLVEQAAQRPHIGGRPRALAPAPVKTVAVRALCVAHQQHLWALHILCAPVPARRTCISYNYSCCQASSKYAVYP